MQCVGEFPLLAKLYDHFQGQGFEIVGISVDDDCEKASDIARSKGVTWPVVCEGQGLKGNLARQYNVEGTPTYYLIGRDGDLVAKRISAKEIEGNLRKAVATRPKSKR